MGTSVNSSERPADSGVTISFGERFAASDQFDAIFREGMALVERAATYLDGSGRKEARQLRGPAAMLYATESMRLTTRLLELASWLMIRRAHKEGEITLAEVRRKLDRVRLTAPGRLGHIKGFDELPKACASSSRRALPSTTGSCGSTAPCKWWWANRTPRAARWKRRWPVWSRPSQAARAESGIFYTSSRPEEIRAERDDRRSRDLRQAPSAAEPG